jgi:serine protease Do
MLKKTILILTVLLIIAIPVFAGGMFTDVKKGAWYYDSVMYVSELGIISGYKDGTFKPTKDVNRAELSKILADYDRSVTRKMLSMSSDEDKTINAVAKAVPSTVEIVEVSTSGSGFFIGKNHIMTNAHVVENLTEVNIRISNGDFISGEVIAVDKDKDIAIIKTKRNSSFLKFETDLEVGQSAIAIGHPFGLKNSVTKGVISRLDVTDIKASTMFQMDMAINSGNSGGAVINIDGEVIGISTAKYSEADGIGFAIMSSELKKFAEANIK